MPEIIQLPKIIQKKTLVMMGLDLFHVTQAVSATHHTRPPPAPEPSPKARVSPRNFLSSLSFLEIILHPNSSTNYIIFPAPAKIQLYLKYSCLQKCLKTFIKPGNSQNSLKTLMAHNSKVINQLNSE